MEQALDQLIDEMEWVAVNLTAGAAPGLLAEGARRLREYRKQLDDVDRRTRERDDARAELAYLKSTRECHQCNGVGHLWRHTVHAPGETPPAPVRVACEHCEGAGRIPL